MEENEVLEIGIRHRSISIVKYKPNMVKLLTDKLRTALLHTYIAQNAATAGWLRSHHLDSFSLVLRRHPLHSLLSRVTSYYLLQHY